MSDHMPRAGYEELVFIGRNCQSCLPPGVGTPFDAANKFVADHPGSYIWEDESGYWVYGPMMPSPEDQALEKFMRTPVKEHIERWEKGLPFKG